VENKKGIEKEIKWSDDIKTIYEKTLKDKIIEAYTLFGQYMPNLYYLDKNWVENWVKLIQPNKKVLWDAFMEGYLFGGRVYDNLYEIMRSHYLQAIDFKFKRNFEEGRLVGHICIGYLRGKENFEEDSLFGKLLKKWKLSQIKGIINFFWMQRDYVEEENITGKIISFWRWVYEKKYKDKKNFNDKDKEILSELSRLTLFLPEINSENKNWLMLSAPYTYISFNSPFFIECLNYLKDKGDSYKYVGKIFLKMLENSPPDFKKEDIRSIVNFLYQKGIKEEANKICNIYGSRGLDFLRNLYEKYNKKET